MKQCVVDSDKCYQDFEGEKSVNFSNMEMVIDSEGTISVEAQRWNPDQTG